MPIHRVSIGVAVMLLAVPGAIATRSIWVDPIDRVDPIRDPHSTPAVRLAEGRSGAVAWIVGGFERSDGRRCVQLQTLGSDETVTGSCTRVPAGAAEIVVATAIQDHLLFVYGTVSPAVARVTVTAAGGHHVVAATRAPDPDALRRSRMADVRVFVAALPEHVDLTRPPKVVATAADGTVLGVAGGASG